MSRRKKNDENDESLRVLDPESEAPEVDVVVLDEVEADDLKAEQVEEDPNERYIMGRVGRFFAKLMPFLTQECPLGGIHWKWSRVCACGFGVVSEDPEMVWHGGVFDMKAGIELHPCAHCSPELSLHHHQWALSYEEEALIQAWRDYREQYLAHFGDEGSFKYEISVLLNATLRTALMEHSQGLQQLSSGQNLAFFVPPTPPTGKPN